MSIGFVSSRISAARIFTSALVLLLVGQFSPGYCQIIGDGRWEFGGSDIHNTRSVDLTNIRLGNVDKLKKKWEFTTMGDVSATPTVQGGVIYAVDWGGWVHALNASNGNSIWSHPLEYYTGNPRSVSRTSPAIIGNLIIIGDQGDMNDVDLFPSFTPGKTASVIAINKNTGALVWRTLVSDHLFSAITSSPVVLLNRVYVGVCALEEAAGFIPGYVYSSRGKVVALDTLTGRLVWERYMAPLGYTGAAVWGSTPVIDIKRGSLYVATGNNYTVPESVEAQIAADSANGDKYLAKDDYIDAIVALDLITGAIKWGKRLQGADTWNVVRGFTPTEFDPAQGPDFDFGSGPNLFFTTRKGKLVELLGAGQKSGKYWALDPDNGSVVWSRQVGPGGVTGGIQWGSATDGERVYCAVSNSLSKPYIPMGSSLTKTNGLWAALDAGTGELLWQTPDPLDGKDYGMVTIANGVMFAGSTSGKMYALNGATGRILWQYDSGSSVVCGPSIVGDTVYWGTGYRRFSQAFGTGGNKLIAFSLP